MNSLNNYRYIPFQYVENNNNIVLCFEFYSLILSQTATTLGRYRLDERKRCGCGERGEAAKDGHNTKGESDANCHSLLSPRFFTYQGKSPSEGVGEGVVAQMGDPWADSTRPWQIWDGLTDIGHELPNAWANFPTPSPPLFPDESRILSFPSPLLEREEEEPYDEHLSIPLEEGGRK